MKTSKESICMPVGNLSCEDREEARRIANAVCKFDGALYFNKPVALAFHELEKRFSFGDPFFCRLTAFSLGYVMGKEEAEKKRGDINEDK